MHMQTSFGTTDWAEYAAWWLKRWLVTCTKESAAKTWVKQVYERPLEANTGNTIHLQFTAGAIGGGAATFCSHWLDTIKVKMQAHPVTFRSGISCLKDALKSEGLRGLYQGATPAIFSSASRAATVFSLFELCEVTVRKFTNSDQKTAMPLELGCTGAMTGVVSSCLQCPLDSVKLTMQMCKKKQGNCKSFLNTGRHLVYKGGVKSLYRGLSLLWAKEVPGAFIYFGAYHYAKALAQKVNPDEQLGPCSHFVCGTSAGLSYCLLHPVDTMKLRMKVVSSESGMHGFGRLFFHIIRKEGLRSLFSGLTPSMIKIGLHSGVQFLVYERMRRLLIA